ncbi:LysM peptidoglycan-binding domain-containing protein [Pseudomonas sp. SA3-5]|uniref:LysM peptidoglycan-binding domain-containing protein n=1 Tax=Pseudomonas aestuarii TaxID=3018340 RepID=A0ABT4XJG0_9PSED|nr:FimV/HubP family polar landmark protein [Pseudomonas aestuarii]MDA7088366.1 LysM peptidoglycan-binding domain-containing protein [Pseudomonas aestuarii]
MVRVRKLVLAIAAASALSSGMAHALGLGEVTLQSALNQPLVAEIELLEVRDLASSELLPNLASPEEFTRAGVDRQYFLTDLKFTPVLKPNGKSYLRVTSSKPVREPYLNFLVEVLWPNGRLLREYTLLLDPPLYSPQTAAAAAPRLPSAAPAPRPLAAPIQRAAAQTSAPVARAPVAAPSALQGTEYKVTANDSLWEIAQRVRGGGSVQQTMLAIQDLNPDAFVGGNINRLKSGQVLRLPEEQQIKSRAQTEAVAQVAEQNAAWREGRSVAASARQMDATRRSVAGAAPAEVKTQDNLKLLSADTGKAASGSDAGAVDSKALSDKLAVTQEGLDSTRRENEELKGRMSDLQGQLEKLQRLIQLKDDQLAKLQADLATQGQAPAMDAPAVAAVPAGPEAAPASPDEAEAPDFNYSEEPATAAAEPQQPVAQPAAAPVAEPAPAPVAKAAAPVAPVKPVEQPPQLSTIDDLLANPMLLGIAGGGALLLLLVGLMMVSRRNALKEAELQESLAAESGGTNFDSDMELPADSFPDDFVDSADSAEPSDERVIAQTSDALGEADIYIAYGRFNQAAELLQNAVNDEPQRSDLRLKLMEVYAELGDRDGFARQENELREIGGSSAEVDQLKGKYPAIAAIAGVGAGVAASALADDDFSSFSLDDLSLDEPDQPAAAAGDLDDAFDLSLDDLESDLEADLEREQQAPGVDASLADLDSLSLDADLDLTAPAETVADEDDDLEFDLNLDDGPADGVKLEQDLADFSLDLDAESKPAVTEAEDDEFLLNLDDELTAESATDELAGLSLDLPSESEGGDFDLSDDFDLSLSDEAPVLPSSDSFAAQLEEVTAELDQLSESLDQPAELTQPAPVAGLQGVDLDGDDDFDFLSGTDETATKLDLARAYIDMGDTEGARDILDEVIAEGNDGQQQEARELIANLV